MHRFITLTFGVILLFLWGCRTPAQLQLTSAPIQPERRTTVAGERLVHLLPVTDGRRGISQLGTVAGRVFSSADLTQWVNTGIRDALRTEGFVSDPTADFTIRAQIEKAYVDSVDIAKTAVLVLEFQYTARGITETKIYRGQDAALNWGSGEAEVTAALQRALLKSLRPMIADVRARTFLSKVAKLP